MRSALRWGAPAIGFAIALLPGVAGSVRDAAPLRVMSFNIRYGTADDGENAWPQRREFLFDVIREKDPAVLGLQEALRFQLDEFASRFDRYGEIGVGRDDGRQAGEYAAILYDRRRLEPIEGGTFWLSDTPEVPGSISWGNHVTRIVTWARFRDRAVGASFYVFNTHWDHESQLARERSASLLLERIAARRGTGEPVLVTGDFNVGEENPALRALVDGGLRDTFRTRHADAAGVATYHGFTGGREGEKVDAILASPEWAVLGSTIVRTNRQGRYPSDHFPVTATVALERR